MTTDHYTGFPEHLAAAAAALGLPADGPEARDARRQPGVPELSHLVEQALGHPAPPADTVRRAREVAAGLALAAVAASSLLRLIDADARSAYEKAVADEDDRSKAKADADAKEKEKADAKAKAAPDRPSDGK